MPLTTACAAALYENPFETSDAATIYNQTESWRDEVRWLPPLIAANPLGAYMQRAGRRRGSCLRALQMRESDTHVERPADLPPLQDLHAQLLLSASPCPFPTPILQLVPLTQLLLEPPADVVYAREPAKPCPQGVCALAGIAGPPEGRVAHINCWRLPCMPQLMRAACMLLSGVLAAACCLRRPSATAAARCCRVIRPVVQMLSLQQEPAQLRQAVPGLPVWPRLPQGRQLLALRQRLCIIPRRLRHVLASAVVARANAVLAGLPCPTQKHIYKQP